MTGWIVYGLRGRRLLRLFAFSGMIFSLGIMQGCAHAEKDVSLSPGVKALLAEFPAGSIDSMKKADEVQEAVKYENQVLDYQFSKDMDACSRKFLVTYCYDEAKSRLRTDRAALKPLSVEADRFKRQEKVRLRDEAQVDAERKASSKIPEREVSRRKYEEKKERYIQGREADEASLPKPEGAAYPTGVPSQLKNPDTVLTPEKRAQNVRDYDEKEREAKKKQEAVLRKKAETQAKRDKRAAKETEEVTTKKQKVAKD